MERFAARTPSHPETIRIHRAILNIREYRLKGAYPSSGSEKTITNGLLDPPTQLAQATGSAARRQRHRTGCSVVELAHEYLGNFGRRYAARRVATHRLQGLGDPAR